MERQRKGRPVASERDLNRFAQRFAYHDYPERSCSNSRTRCLRISFSRSNSCTRSCLRARHRLAEMVFCRRFRSTADRISDGISSSGMVAAGISSSMGMSGGEVDDADDDPDPDLGEPRESGPEVDDDGSLALCRARFLANRRSNGTVNRFRLVLAGTSQLRGWTGASRAIRGLDGSRNPVG